MNKRHSLLIVLLLVLGVSLLSQTMALAEDGDGLNAHQRPGGGSKFPGNEAPTPVPEPATMILLGSGIVGLLGLHKKRRTEDR